MLCCGPREATPMARYAQLLRKAKIATEEAPTVWFPMYVLPLASLLQLREMRPHEELMAAGKLLEFDEGLGNALFVSHQWLGADHPDPEMKQMSVLQGVLTHLMSDLQTIPTDFISETLVPGAKGLPTSELRSRPLFVWYDYFSCPQEEDTSFSVERMRRSRSKLCRAVDSIPAYVAKSSFFLALCPIIENTSRSKLLTPTTWTERGWCCAERTFRELSLNKSWIIVRSHTDAQLVVNPVESLGKPAGEGNFTVPGDRCQLQPLLEAGLKRILQSHLKARDFVGYRVMLNLQSVYLRGYTSGFLEPVPGFSDKESDSPFPLAVAKFKYQNGFESIQEVDRAGWSPLHYAALLGDPEVVQGLLAQKADPNRTTQKGQWRVGMPPWTSALALCVYFKHNSAARSLISARARVQAGLLMPPLMTAALADNPEGIRILCDAGCKLHARNLVGAVALYAASSHGSILAMEELLAQAARDGDDLQLGPTLCFAAMFHGCSAELVHRLLQLRADVNERFNAWEVSKRFGVFNFLHQLPHRLGRSTKLARFSYHSQGATPLLFALLSSQWEGASAFISAGARLDLRNSRGVSPADVLREVQAPDFVMQAMRGNLAGCERVSALACNGSRTGM